VSAIPAHQLNADAGAGRVDRAALDSALQAQGEEFYRYITEHCPHLFSSVAYFISTEEAEEMHAIIAAVERVIALPAWREALLERASLPFSRMPRALGVFTGYDFHLNDDGAHLIEINTNAGGAFLNHLLLQSQQGVSLPGEAAASGNLEQAYVEMFRNEWRLERDDAPLSTIAIVDEAPKTQYLYPEFLLAQRMLARAGIATSIAAPADLRVEANGLYCGEQKIDMVYNRLTDFYFRQHAALNACYRDGSLAVVTPHPWAYALYADKHNLTALTSQDALRALDVGESVAQTLLKGIPRTETVKLEEHQRWWNERKHWFFKPESGFGSKGAYRGASVTRRVFDEIVKGGYVAQRLAAPPERAVCGEKGESRPLKADIRCYVYAGKITLMAARLYQGQTTNFRTENGGFAQVRIVG
jgi:hypothetical protein